MHVLIHNPFFLQMVFSFFLQIFHEVVHKLSKMTEHNFSGNLSFAKQGQEREQYGPQRMDFLIISQNWIFSFCLKWPKGEWTVMWRHWTQFPCLINFWFLSYVIKSSRPMRLLNSLSWISSEPFDDFNRWNTVKILLICGLLLACPGLPRFSINCPNIFFLLSFLSFFAFPFSFLMSFLVCEVGVHCCKYSCSGESQNVGSLFGSKFQQN